jgi:hypothetical protein
METEFILIDFENVQPKNVGVLRGGSFKIKVFLGASQGRVPLEMAQTLQAFGPDAEYIQIDGNGSNALDFHIAYYIGRLGAEHPGASFTVVSKDTGFDPLIRHLRARGLSCRRSKSISDITPVVKPAPKSHPEKIDVVINNLTKRKASRPRTLKTLRSTIRSLFADRPSDEDVDRLIEQLSGRGALKVSDGKVQYELP